MLGAIIGDMAGSKHEFRVGKIDSYNFPFFEEGSFMTDDSILTLAVMDGAVRGLNDPEASRIEIAKSFKLYARTHAHRGYGGRFRAWFGSDSLEGYNSLGNGAAMRVSPIAYLYDNLEDVEKYAEISAMPTHDHPEGIRGARAIAGAIFLALNGASKAAIETYIVQRCGYELPESVAWLRENHSFDVTCAGSVPPAVRCFLEADKFEDCIRNCIWIGGDADTNAAIAGGIAEAFWGIPYDIVDAAYRVIDKDRTPGLRPEVERRVAALRYIRAARRYELPPEDRYDKRKMLAG